MLLLINHDLLQEGCRVPNSIILSGMWDFYSEYKAQRGNSGFFCLCAGGGCQAKLDELYLTVRR